MSQFDQVHSVKKYRLMTTKKDVAGNEYIYLKGVASLVAGDAVTYDEAGVTTLLAANAKGPVAIAMATVDATTEFGWFCIAGSCTANLVANSADDATLGRETTNGKLGDGRAAGDQIANLFARGATSGAGTATVQLRYPYVDDFQGA
jgi:hypothetical protein